MAVRKFLRSQLFRGLSWLSEDTLAAFAKRYRPLHIIQAGANDGKSNDFIHQLNRSIGNKAILIEPVPYVFSQLKEEYAACSNVQLLQVAVAESSITQRLPFYYLKPVPGFDFPGIYNQWGSFSLEHLQKFAIHVQHFEALLTVELVNTLTLNQIMEESGFPTIDILATDVEGFDGKIIASIDFSRFRPRLILFEHIHIEKGELKLLFDLLKSIGYRSYSVGFDTISLHESVTMVDWRLRIIKWGRSKWLQPAM